MFNPYIHQKEDWPHFVWNTDELMRQLGEVRNLQGRLVGRMETMGFDLRNEAILGALTLDVLKSSEIEGELLSPDQVRSSIARKLGMDISGAVPSDRNVDGVVEMMVDANKHCFDPLTADRLFGWHNALFPAGYSGMYKITVANWRKDTTGPMQVVSGAMGKEKVHFEAPPAEKVPKEMEQFLKWFNQDATIDLVLKAAIAHLWFVTVHPFEDGNGRITRALTDLLLAQSDESTQRFYSLSAQIREDRKGYYQILEQTQQGGMDITPWLRWFLDCLLKALKATNQTLNTVLFKAEFWKTHAKTSMNERQVKVLNKLLDGFEGKMSSSKYAKIAKCSRDIAIRDINDLIKKNVLEKQSAGGRSTHYDVVKTQA